MKFLSVLVVIVLTSSTPEPLSAMHVRSASPPSVSLAPETFSPSLVSEVVSSVILPTLTASPTAALTATPTTAPTNTPTNTPTVSPTSVPTETPRPTLTPSPTITSLPTPTSRAPHDIALDDSLNSEEQRMILDGLNLLKSCAPPMYDYVRTYISRIARGNDAPDANAYVYVGNPTVYLPFNGQINDPMRYKDSMRTFVAAITLVHEARHLAVGAKTTEPDAYGFTLPLFEPCKPNDIGNAGSPWNWRQGANPYLMYANFHSYVEWRASLPYPGEPPASAVFPGTP